jgi:recombination associated protein RdgC
MWFKNLTLFRFTEPFSLSAAELEEKLSEMRFRPCGAHDEFSFGWTSPLGASSEQLVYAVNGYMLLCGKREEKVLPACVVNDFLQEKISEIETQQMRKLSKKERSTMKDELIHALLPKAFSFSRNTFLYLDFQNGWLVVDSATAKKAEELLSYLRKSLGTLPAVPVNTRDKPVLTMTQWLIDNQAPADITIEEECELRAPEMDGAVVRCKKQDLSLPEVKNHLEMGKQVIKLALNWEERFSFVLDENLAVKRLRFLGLVQDQVGDGTTGGENEQFDADFALMTLEFSHFLPRLLDLFGGEHKN